MQLGEFGAWTSYRAIGEENAGEAARLTEDLGVRGVPRSQWTALAAAARVGA